MAMYLKITDGTTTVDLLGNDAANSFNLLLGSWGPAVAKRKRSQLGGNWAEDVVETIPLYVQSTTSAETVLANIETLTALIDQARRWALGEAVDPVIIRYSPNSDSVYLQAAILGPPDDGPAVVLPPTFVDDLYQNVVDGVTLQFKRRGLWLGAEETRSRTASTSYNPGVLTPSSAFTLDMATPSPIKLTLGLTDVFPAAEGMLLIAKSSSYVSLIQGESFGGGTNYASASDSGASGGNVGRYTPNDTNSNLISGFTITINSNVRLVSVVASLKNRSSTVSYKIRAVIGSQLSPWKIIDTTDNNPQVISFGIISSTQAITTMSFYIQASTGGSASDSLDIDVIGVVALDDSVGRTISVESLNDAAINLVYDHRLLTSPTPLAYGLNGATVTGRPDKGVVNLSGVGTSLAVLPIINSGANWRLLNSSSSLQTIGMTAVRRPAYLVPK